MSFIGIHVGRIHKQRNVKTEAKVTENTRVVIRRAILYCNFSFHRTYIGWEYILFYSGVFTYISGQFIGYVVLELLP